VNINVTMYGQGDKDSVPSLPQELYRMHRETIEMLVTEMRKYSIGHIVLELRQHGAVPLTTLRWEALDDLNAPEQLLHARHKVLRAIQLYAELYGIHTLGIKLSATEFTELHTLWQYLKDGTKPDVGDVPSSIPLRFERDPTTPPHKQSENKRKSSDVS
jgi:hypothetical protein